MQPETNRINNNDCEFLELWAAWNMEKLVYEPTRGANYLDLVITTTPENFESLYVCDPILTSDHCLVACQWTTVTSTESLTNVRYNFMLIDFSSMFTILKAID